MADIRETSQDTMGVNLMGLGDGVTLWLRWPDAAAADEPEEPDDEDPLASAEHAEDDPAPDSGRGNRG